MSFKSQVTAEEKNEALSATDRSHLCPFPEPLTRTPSSTTAVMFGYTYLLYTVIFFIEKLI